LVAAFGFKYEARSKTLLSTPPYTNGSWMMVLPALVSGSETILVSRFDPAAMIETIASHAPTHAFIVPTQFHALFGATTYSPKIFETFTCLVTAGAPMPEQMKTRLLREAPGKLYELWLPAPILRNSSDRRQGT
jgi:acyl-coenzyme A synthetase/AMP-(fatty) acid ligase